MKRIICLAFSLILLLNPLLVKAVGAHACEMLGEHQMSSMQMSKADNTEQQMQMHTEHDCCDDDAAKQVSTNASCNDCNDCAAKCHTSCCLFAAISPVVEAGIAYAAKSILLIPYPEPYSATVIPPIA